MNKLLWLTGGATLGIAVYILLKQQPTPAYSNRYGARDLGDDAADATDNLRAGAASIAGKVDRWGTGQRISGTAGQIGGRLEQGAANLTGSQDLADKGVGDEVVGAAKDAAGKVAHAVSDTIHDLNK